MEKDVLSQVIEAEKEIQKCIEAERAKAREWLDSERKQAEEAFLLEQEKIKHYQEQSLAAADREAETKIQEIVREAARSAERLGQLDTKVLLKLVEQRMSGILPG